MSRIVLVAPSRLALASLEAALGDDTQVTVVNRTTHLDAVVHPLASAGASVAIVAVDDLGPLRSALTIRDDEHQPLPIVLLVPPDDMADAVTLLSSGAVRAVLARHATSREILAAVDAAMSGLFTLTPDAVDVLMRPTPRPVRLPPPTGLVPLSPREREILALVADGLGNKIVAARLGISEHTVKTHVTSIFTKLGAESRAEAVAIGARIGALML